MLRWSSRTRDISGDVKHLSREFLRTHRMRIANTPRIPTGKRGLGSRIVCFMWMVDLAMWTKEEAVVVVQSVLVPNVSHLQREIANPM